jgi:hypothetical protein
LEVLHFFAQKAMQYTFKSIISQGRKHQPTLQSVIKQINKPHAIMFGALCKLLFKKKWKENHSHLPDLNDSEKEYYLRTSARVNKNLPKDIQIKKAAEMAADDYSGDGIHF